MTGPGAPIVPATVAVVDVDPLARSGGDERKARGRVGVIVVLALLAATAAIILPDSVLPSATAVLYAAGYGGAFIAARRVGFRLAWRGHTARVSLEEFTLVGGLMLLPGSHLVFATVLSVLANELFERRRPMKTLFHVAQYALAAGVVVVAFDALVMAGVAPLWATIQAPFLFAFASQLATAALVARMEEDAPLRVFRRRFLHWAVVGGAIGASIGLGAYALLMLHPALLFAIVPVFVLLARFGRLSEWADEEVRVHKALAESTTRAAATGDFDTVATALLETCGNIFGAGEVRLALAMDDAGPAVWRWAHPEGATPNGLRVIVPTPSGPPGEIVVYPRTGRPLYGERDRHLLAIVAASAAASAAGTLALRELKEANVRLRNANRELDEFTLWTTHDMREPLRSVGQLARILHEDLGRIPEAEARDLTHRIWRGSENLKDRIKALHEFSRVVQEDVPFENVDLGEILDEAREGLAVRIAEQGARIDAHGQLPVVRGQRARLARVFGNLIENALKYNDKAAPRVEISAAERDGAWEILVADNGPGVPAACRERIFGLFQRGPDVPEGGSGAGLAIVKRIVEQHGGLVWVDEAPCGGATFRFTLPQDGAPKRAPTPLVAMRKRS